MDSLGICCTACRGFVLGIQFVANMLGTCVEISLDATVPEIELMESRHSTRKGVCDTRVGDSLTSDSRYTADGRARIVYDALAYEIF